MQRKWLNCHGSIATIVDQAEAKTTAWSIDIIAVNNIRCWKVEWSSYVSSYLNIFMVASQKKMECDKSYP